MKNFSLLLLFLIAGHISLAQIHVKSSVHEVTLYLTAAEISATETILLKDAKNTITLHGLPFSMVANSLQISVPPGVELLSVQTREVSVDPSAVDKQIQTLRDSLNGLAVRMENFQNQIDAYHAEKETLKENQRLGGPQSTVSIVELNKAADFFRERNLKINNAISALNRKMKQIQVASDTLKQRYDARLAQIKPLANEVELVLNGTPNQKIALSYRYLTGNAGWGAAYDLIAADVNKPVTLRYKAQIYNNTGIDWTNVKVILSTGDPTLNASRPQLTAWTLNYTSTGNEGYLNYSNTRSNANVASFEDKDEEFVAASELSTTFPIEKRQSVPSSQQPYWIDLSPASLNATFEYLTIPKVDASAFLIAKVTGWEKLNLIDGIAHVYFGNAYIGESRIDTRNMSDTLELSLGRDNQILVTRVKLEDKGETKVIGTKRTESFRYEIIVKNNRTTPIDIRIQDQIPVSQESDITVDAEELSGASHDLLSGRLQWIKTIAAGQSIRLANAFSVRYPKGKQVNVRKQRMIRTPRYKR